MVFPKLSPVSSWNMFLTRNSETGGPTTFCMEWRNTRRQILTGMSTRILRFGQRRRKLHSLCLKCGISYLQAYFFVDVEKTGDGDAQIQLGVWPASSGGDFQTAKILVFKDFSTARFSPASNMGIIKVMQWNWYIARLCYQRIGHECCVYLRVYTVTYREIAAAAHLSQRSCFPSS